MGEYAGRVAFVNENFGESELARRFGVKRYPAIFVDGVLVAKPKDFGFYGTGGSQGEGRYTPFKDAANHKRFQDDLRRMIDLALAGKRDQLLVERPAETDAGEVLELPVFELTGLDGRPLTPAQVDRRVVVVEFWASWCPPCEGTLKFLRDLKARHPDDLEVVAIAVESPEDDVRRMVASLGADVRWAMGTPGLASAFGDVVAVPTLFVFDRAGRTAGVFYGAPDDLHDRADALVKTLVDQQTRP